jgi:hypothetical protein
MTKTIYLQRQGCSDTLNTNNLINHRLPYFIEIQKFGWYKDSKGKIIHGENPYYSWNICYSSYHEINNTDKRGQIAAMAKEPVTLDVAKYQVQQTLLERFNVDIKISDLVEAYMFNQGKWYTDVTKNDIFFAAAAYSKQTDTIRTMDNCCLVSFTPDGPVFNFDAFNARYIQVCEKCYRDYVNQGEVNGKDEETRKGWLAWLISETIKEQFTDAVIRPIKEITPADWWKNELYLPEPISK